MKVTGLGMGSLMFPACSRQVPHESLKTALSVDFKRKLSDIALNAATAAGASYADVRTGRYLRQYVITRENRVKDIISTESTGIGIRVIADGTWGFAASDELSEKSAADNALLAVKVAKANSRLQKEPVILAPVESTGEISWATPIEINSMEVPVEEKVDLLLRANSAAMKSGADFVNSMLMMANDQKYFASTEGSYIDQDIHRIWPSFKVTVVDKKSGDFRSRSALAAPAGRGWDYMQCEADHRLNLPPGVRVYTDGYDMVEDAASAAVHAREKINAKSVETGEYDLILDPSNLWLTIHESVGHALELDRVLGYEANFAGTSFATLDKWKSGSFRYGSEKVNLVADRIQPGSLSRVAYDDEGVRSGRWDLVRNGILVDYQTIRDQTHILGQKQSHGCCFADSWSSVQFQRMPNVSLKPGKNTLSVNDLFKKVENGIYIIGNGSYSIDHQRLNFQFGGQLFYEIKNGKIGRMLENVAYQSRTPDFWNSLEAVCDKGDYRLGGSFFCGKGQPMQTCPVSHGTSTALFRKIKVLNTRTDRT